MSEFYPLLKRLFSEAQRLVQSAFDPADGVGRKWVLRDGQLKLELVPNPRNAGVWAYLRVRKPMQDLQAYSDLEDAIENDRVFKDAPEEAGYWGTPRAILTTLFADSCHIDGDNLLFDARKADDLLVAFRTKLASRSLTFQARARALGVDMHIRSIVFPDGLKLVRLTDSEINESHSFVDPFFPPHPGFKAEDFYLHHAEFQLDLTVPVPRSDDDDTPFLQASSEVHGRAAERFDKGLAALRLAQPGRIELGPVVLRGGISSGTATLTRGDLSRFFSRDMTLESADEDRLKAAYEILAGTCPRDRVLDRAIHRFLLGRRRLDQHDRVVDYVIAWETVLLTSRGSAASGELAYRFAVNGASILNSVRPGRDRRDVFRQMRAAYGTRSAIVHASPEKQMAKETAKGGFRDLIDLGKFLEVAFRDTVYWLARLAPASRPYTEAGGWEDLLWSDSHMA